MERLKVGDEIAIAGILKVSAVQPNRNGTVSYSFDRGFSLHENTVDQMALKPYEKPVLEEVVKDPTYTGKVVATGLTKLGLNDREATLRIGRVFEIKDGFIVGDRATYGFAINPSLPFKSYDNFLDCHRMNTWLEIKD